MKKAGKIIFGGWVRMACLVVCGVALSVACALTLRTTDAQAQATQSVTPTTAQAPAATTAAKVAGAYPELPAEQGKDVFVRVCSQCHSPDNVMALAQGREGWENTVSQMVGYGAQGSDDDFTTIVAYLAKNFPAPAAAKINVNRATAQELATGLSLTQTEAQAIVQYRQANGDFKSIDDLKKVTAVDAKKLDAVKDRLAF